MRKLKCLLKPATKYNNIYVYINTIKYIPTNNDQQQQPQGKRTKTTTTLKNATLYKIPHQPQRQSQRNSQQ